MMTKIQNTKNNEKMAEYCKTCVCKSCEKIAELKAYKDVNEDFKTAWEELKAENERLKEEKGGMQILIDNYIALTEKYHQTLQEIKAIAERAFAVCDDDCGNANNFTEILDLITKAEEE